MKVAVDRKNDLGFTLVEVIIASVVMVILCVGTLTVFSYAVRVNRGNNLRAQALSVLQQEVEYYRSLKFVPVGSNPALNAGTFPDLRTRTSPDGRVFRISVTIDNDPFTTGVQTTPVDGTCKFKEITVTAEPQVQEENWLADLKTKVTFQRVRSN